MTTAATTWRATAGAIRTTTAESDLELVRLAKKGDSGAFSLLVARHQHMVYNVSFRFMRESALAEDMAQEAFLKAFRVLKGFRGDSSFSTWMYRVTASVCLTELSKRKRRNEVPFLPAHENRTDSKAHDTFDMPDLIRQCVGELPERYATIITLYYLDEACYDEIARVMGVPMGTLKTWMHRARKKLRKIVEKELNGHGPF
ncbi:MAG: sigma-70 family RNA polymerase sigma factor [Nitrospiraceae bacterium]|nr:sigma-70 family RNA polymerase sigma factor [Nitrospiraceae bacterium]